MFIKSSLDGFYTLHVFFYKNIAYKNIKPWLAQKFRTSEEGLARQVVENIPELLYLSGEVFARQIIDNLFTEAKEIDVAGDG